MRTYGNVKGLMRVHIRVLLQMYTLTNISEEPFIHTTKTMLTKTPSVIISSPYKHAFFT